MEKIKFNLDALKRKPLFELKPEEASAVYQAINKVDAIKSKMVKLLKENLEKEIKDLDFSFSAEITFRVAYDGEPKIEIVEKPIQQVSQVLQRTQAPIVQTTVQTTGRGQKVPRTFIVVFPDGRQETFQIANKASKEIARYLNDNVPGSFEISAKLLGHANQAEVLKSMRQTLENLGFQIEILEG